MFFLEMLVRSSLRSVTRGVKDLCWRLDSFSRSRHTFQTKNVASSSNLVNVTDGWRCVEKVVVVLGVDQKKKEKRNAQEEAICSCVVDHVISDAFGIFILS